MNVVKEDMQRTGGTEENGVKVVRWRKMIHCGDSSETSSGKISKNNNQDFFWAPQKTTKMLKPRTEPVTFRSSV